MNKILVVMVAGLLGLMALTGLVFISYNNSFATMEEGMKGTWAQVENQLKRRADLIPNLVETVKGYASHEKEIFSGIAEARSKLLGAGTIAGKIEADQQLTGALGRLLAVAENYPNLKADASFTRLQDELAGTENRIAVERKRYNEAVQQFNTAMRRLPGSLVAGMLGFEKATYFEVSEAERATPKVSF